MVAMVQEATSVAYEETDSVLEALILEANLIKKHQPPYNTRDKDNKSYNYLIITKEDFPRVLVVRGRELFQKWDARTIKKTFGPYPEGGSLKEAVKLVRKIFPFRDTCTPAAQQKRTPKPCFNRHIGLCPGVCDGAITKAEYAHNVRHIMLLFSGKKTSLLKELERSIVRAVKQERFEDAARMQKQVFALTHIRDVALIKHAVESRGGEVQRVRIEGYDVAHTAGSSARGVMTVVENGELKKSDYRLFTIRSVKNDDTKALHEVLTRRLAHTEWPLPDVLVIDGGKGQLAVAERMVDEMNLKISVVSVVKDERHKPRDILGDQTVRARFEKEILLVNREAHRFSITAHRKALRKRLIDD